MNMPKQNKDNAHNDHTTTTVSLNLGKEVNFYFRESFL